MNWFDELERMRQRMEQLSSAISPSLTANMAALAASTSAAQAFTKTFQASTVFSDAVAASAFRSQVLASTEAIRQITEPLHKLTTPSVFAELTEELNRSQLTFADLAKNVALPTDALRDISLSMKAVATLAAPVPVFDLVNDVVQRSLALQQTELDSFEAAEEIERPYLEKAKSIGLAPATARQYLSLMLAVLGIWVTLYAAAQSDALMRKVSQSLRGVSDALEYLHDEADGGFPGKMRAIKRPTTVHSHPGGRRGRAFGMIYEGKLVEVELWRGRWVAVRWYDAKREEMRRGWIRKKYLQARQR